LVLAEVSGGGRTGLGYTYSAAATAQLIADDLAETILGKDVFSVSQIHAAMIRRVRNLGHCGIARMAISAVDAALWDLKARLLDLPLVRLLGPRRTHIPIYGSGGFTTYTEDQLREQLAGWVEQGIPRVKMKVGADPALDPHRVRVAREAIGPSADLMVDGNNAFDRRGALEFMQAVADQGVKWFEQPLATEDHEGVRRLRDLQPSMCEIADGEYAFVPLDFLRLLQNQAADVLMPDMTRCGGVTGLLQVAEMCASWGIPISTHCAPALNLHPCCAVHGIRHAEFFHDHARVEAILFEGVPQPLKGALQPDLTAPGNGLSFRRKDAEQFLVHAR
jgi:L-alanine-DL-glutamate epimerase-like enolase superfamily enzyme